MNTSKPCPFCGGLAELKNPGYEHYSPCWYKCTQCGAEGPTKSSELEAEECWNKRIETKDGVNIEESLENITAAIFELNDGNISSEDFYWWGGVLDIFNCHLDKNGNLVYE